MSAIPGDDGKPFGVAVKPTGFMPVTTMQRTFGWLCAHCTWTGNGYTDPTTALKEAADHLWEEHGIAACYPEWYGGPHVWKHIPKSDALSKCGRCEWVIGK